MFLIDPTEDCGYSLELQESLRKRIQDEFPEAPFLVVETRLDLKDSGSDRLKVSGETGQGVEEIKTYIIDNVAVDDIAVDREILRLMEEREEREE